MKVRFNIEYYFEGGDRPFRARAALEGNFRGKDGLLISREPQTRTFIGTSAASYQDAKQDLIFVIKNTYNSNRIPEPEEIEIEVGDARAKNP